MSSGSSTHISDSQHRSLDRARTFLPIFYQFLSLFPSWSSSELRLAAAQLQDLVLFLGEGCKFSPKKGKRNGNAAVP